MFEGFDTCFSIYRYALVNVNLAVSGPHRQALTAWGPLDVRDVFLRVTCRVKDLWHGGKRTYFTAFMKTIFGSIKKTFEGIHGLRDVFKRSTRNGKKNRTYRESTLRRETTQRLSKTFPSFTLGSRETCVCI